MAAVKEYKCLNCHAGLAFDPESGSWKCDYCFSQFTKEQLDEVYGHDHSEELDQEEQDLDTYHCTSCGADLIADDTTTATFCIYCKSPTVIKQRFTGKFKPRYVIPFKITKEEAVKKYGDWIRKKFLAPKIFKTEEEIHKITGIYAPFWMYDCIANAGTSGEGTKVSSWVSGKYRYTKTSYYFVERQGSAAYTKIPVDSSTKLDDRFMHMIEPYDYSDLKDFSMHFLTGFMAEKYDVEEDACEKIMKERVEGYVESRLNETIHGYSSFHAATKHVDLEHVKNEYALLPIYLIINKYNNKDHIFIMNGQTGKIVGNTPIDVKRQALLFSIVAGATWVITAIGGAIIGF